MSHTNARLQGLGTMFYIEVQTSSPQVAIPDLEVHDFFMNLSALLPDMGLVPPMSGEKLPASRSGFQPRS